jgi:hypothetical protein
VFNGGAAPVKATVARVDKSSLDSHSHHTTAQTGQYEEGQWEMTAAVLLCHTYVIHLVVPVLIWPTEAVTHMWDKHRTTVAMAVEAINDPDVVAFIPDPKSRSGKSNRFIGCSPTADRVLVVIVVDHDGQQ